MSFEDKSLQCSDCSTTFTFSAEEQEFFNLNDIKMNPSAAPHAAKQGNRSATKVVAMATLNAKCSRQHVPNVAKIPRYRSNPVKIDQYTAASAT